MGKLIIVHQSGGIPHENQNHLINKFMSALPLIWSNYINSNISLLYNYNKKNICSINNQKLMTVVHKALIQYYIDSQLWTSNHNLKDS